MTSSLHYNGLETTSTPEDEDLHFTTLGTDIDEAFEFDEDVDECLKDNYGDDE